MQRVSIHLGAPGSCARAPSRALWAASANTQSHLPFSRKIANSSSLLASGQHVPAVRASTSLQLTLTSTRHARPSTVHTTKSQIAIFPATRRGFASTNRNRESEGSFVNKDADGAGGGSRRRVEVNLAESVDQVAMGYLKKYGRKVAIEWPLQGLKYGALAAFTIGGAGYMAASAIAQKARSLFGGREVASYDPAGAAAKKKEGGFFSRMLKSHLQEALAHEVSRTMSLMTALSQTSRLQEEMGGEVMIDMEQAMDRGDYLNSNTAAKHPRFEMSTVRTWEYDEHWIISATGRRARLCVQGYLDEKEDMEREMEEKREKKKRAKERKKLGLEPEQEEEKNGEKPEKSYNWHFVHISAFFDNDRRQIILTHDAEAGEDLIILPDAEWPGEERRGAPYATADPDVAEAWADHEYDSDDDEAMRQRRARAPQFIDAEVVQPKKGANKKKR